MTASDPADLRTIAAEIVQVRGCLASPECSAHFVDVEATMAASGGVEGDEALLRPLLQRRGRDADGLRCFGGAGTPDGTKRTDFPGSVEDRFKLGVLDAFADRLARRPGALCRMGALRALRSVY